jgi:hypothetical protein
MLLDKIWEFLKHTATVMLVLTLILAAMALVAVLVDYLIKILTGIM